MVAQFTTKTTNSGKAIYFLSLTPCSINKVSHLLFICRNFKWKKKLLQEMVRVWCSLPSLSLRLWSVLSFSERNKANILSFTFRSKKLRILRFCFKRENIFQKFVPKWIKEFVLIKLVSTNNIAQDNGLFNVGLFHRCSLLSSLREKKPNSCFRKKNTIEQFLTK